MRNRKRFTCITRWTSAIVQKQVKYKIIKVLIAFVEKRLQQGILLEIARLKKEALNTIPIMYRVIKDSTIFFNSKFESGNLREVERISDLEYNLYLNFDFNTLNYT